MTAELKEMREVIDLPYTECKRYLVEEWQNMRIPLLEKENAKLWELVRALDWHIRTDGLCADCPLGLAPDAPYEVMCDVMIEELGIEVEV